MKKRLLALVLAFMMVLSSSAYAATLQDYFDDGNYDATISGSGVELSLKALTDVGVKTRGVNNYVNSLQIKATTASALPSVDFGATLQMGAVRNDFLGLVAVAEEYVQNEIPQENQEAARALFDSFAVTGQFVITVNAAKGLVVSDEYQNAGAGFDFTNSAFEETVARVYDDTSDPDYNIYTVTVDVIDGLTVADIKANLNNLLKNIMFTCNGVSASSLDTSYDVSVQATGLVEIGSVCDIEFVFTPADSLGATVVTSYVSDTGLPPKEDETTTGTITTTTTHNPDGSVTTTVVNEKEGTITETTVYPDGTVVVELIDKDGSTTIATELPDGTTIVTVEHPNGQVDTTVTIDESAIDADAPVDVPVNPVDSDKPNVIEVVVPDSVTPQNPIEIYVPANDVQMGVVAAVTNEDGTTTILPTIPTDNGYIVTVNGTSTFSFTDNSIDFADIGGHWAEGYIDFVSARGLFNGVSETLFDCDGPMTRGMMMTVLARMSGIDTSNCEPWYAKGREWAMDVGVSDGTNPENPIKRQELVTMLYRYVGLYTDIEQAEHEVLLPFEDHTDIHEYALPAMRWAVDNSIIIGTSDETIHPLNMATRAQLAAILTRYIINAR